MCFNVQPSWKTTVWTNRLSPSGTGPDACEYFGFCWPERRQMELGLGRSSIVAVTANPTSRSQKIWNTGQENIQGKERKDEGGNKKTYTMTRKCLPGRVSQYFGGYGGGVSAFILNSFRISHITRHPMYHPLLPRPSSP